MGFANKKFILIAQSEIIDHEGFTKLPLDRVELYRDLVYPRMINYAGRFRSHLDVVNHFAFGRFFDEAPTEQQKDLLSVWNLPSLAGLEIANFLSAHGLDVSVINNYDAEEGRFKELYHQKGPDVVVGISSTFHLGWASVARLAERLRNVDPDMTIISGGAMFPALLMHSPAAAWEKNLRKSRLDAVLLSLNSEADLLAYLQNTSEDYSGVPGLAWFDSDGHFQVNAPVERPPQLGGQPDHWGTLDLPFLRRTLQTRTSVGCPYSCAFCSYPIMARGYHPHDLDSTRRMLDHFSARGLSQLVFLDDTLNIGKKRFLDICKILSRRNWAWFSFLRAQLVDEESAAAMRDSGCQAVFLGLESGSDLILKNMNKKADRRAMEQGLNWLRKYGIITFGCFIIGFPGETEATVKETADLIHSGGLDFYTLKEFYSLPGTGADGLREMFGLEGYGNVWKHNTMNSTEASAIKADIFKQTERPLHLDPDTGLWSVVAMTDAGFTLPEIVEIQKNINLAVADQMDGRFDDRHPAYERIWAAIGGSAVVKSLTAGASGRGLDR